MTMIDKICNFLRKKQRERSRFGLTRTVHVTDVTGRLDEVYLQRVLDTAPQCANLARMETGSLWERSLINLFREEGFVHEPQYIATIKTNRGDFRLVATPDFVREEVKPAIYELKTTRWSFDEIAGTEEFPLRGIVPSQLNTLRGLDVDIPEYDPREYGIFINVMGQLSAYRTVFGYRRKVPLYCIYIYRDQLREYELRDDLLKRYWEEYFMRRLPDTLSAVLMAERGFDKRIAILLWAREIINGTGLLGYITNQYSPYVAMDLTLPLPPIHTPRREDMEYFRKIHEFFQLPFEMPIAVEEVARNRGHVGDGVMARVGLPPIPTPAPEDYVEAKRSLYVYLRRLRAFLERTWALMASEVEPPRVEVLEIEWYGVKRSPLRKRRETVVIEGNNDNKEKKRERAKPKPRESNSGPLEEIPEEVRAYLNVLNLELIRAEKRKGLPEFKGREAWFLTVRDEGTGEEITIVYPFPTYRESYELVTIINKKGRSVNVLVPKEEKEKIEPRIPKEEEIKEVKEEVERRIRVTEKEKRKAKLVVPINREYFKGVLKKIQGWLKAVESSAKARNAIAVSAYLGTIETFLREFIEALKRSDKMGKVKAMIEKKPTVVILKEEDKEKLWDLFCKLLRLEGLDCKLFREDFEENLDPSSDFEFNKFVTKRLANIIIANAKLGLKPIEVKKAIKFSWKYIGWALGALSVELMYIKDAFEKGATVELVMHIEKMLKTIKTLLSLLPEIPKP